MPTEIHIAPGLLFTAALAALGLVYGRGWHRLRKALPNVVSRWRLVAFLGGLVSVWAATGSPLATLDHHLLIAHMAQHLLLMTVAAPLILLSAPVAVLLQGIAPRFCRPLLQYSSPAMGSFVTHPVFCWFVSTATVMAWHVPALFALGMSSGSWHAFEHATFFVAGLLFWLPVVRPWPSVAAWPRWAAPLYLYLATLPCDALSAFLTFCDRVVYPHYVAMDGHFGVSALDDQESAGALMWIWVTFVYLVPAAVITIQMLSPQRRASAVKVGDYVD